MSGLYNSFLELVIATLVGYGLGYGHRHLKALLDELEKGFQYAKENLVELEARVAEFEKDKP